MVQTSISGPAMTISKPQKSLKTSINKADILSQIKVNSDLLTAPQLARLEDIHVSNISAFDEDMSGGYRNKTKPYLATFSFREENMAPHYNIWVPQFNRGCQDLMQDKCDQLVEQGVLVNPKEHGIDIRHVSPCFIQEKGRAKHKKLEEWSS